VHFRVYKNGTFGPIGLVHPSVVSTRTVFELTMREYLYSIADHEEKLLKFEFLQEKRPGFLTWRSLSANTYWGNIEHKLRLSRTILFGALKLHLCANDPSSAALADDVRCQRLDHDCIPPTNVSCTDTKEAGITKKKIAKIFDPKNQWTSSS